MITTTRMAPDFAISYATVAYTEDKICVAWTLYKRVLDEEGCKNFDLGAGAWSGWSYPKPIRSDPTFVSLKCDNRLSMAIDDEGGT